MHDAVDLRDAVEPHLDLLVCPNTRQALRVDGDRLVSADGGRAYPITPSGIPAFVTDAGELREESRIQQQHYDRVAASYIENLSYPHTLEYLRYLDGGFDDALAASNPDGGLGDIAEICCGRGEAIRLLDDEHAGDVTRCVGVDISLAMLESARGDIADRTRLFVQGDATKLPMPDGAFDNVFVFGGIHHVNDRDAMFGEILRVLKPGGRFYWREPVDDFFLWRWLRAVIYRFSPALDYETEHPLRYRDTADTLSRVGFELERWRTYGFFGFCVFMNSDVLVLNRLFRYVPGIRLITRFAAWCDDVILHVPGMGHAGTQVVGVARKPA